MPKFADIACVTTTDFSWIHGALPAGVLVPVCEQRAELWRQHAQALSRVAACVSQMQRSGGQDAFDHALSDAVIAKDRAVRCHNMAKDHEREHGCGPCLG